MCIRDRSLGIEARHTPPPFRWAVERCLAKEPAHRFASTAGLHQQLRDLRDHLTDLSISQTQASAPVIAAKRRLLPALLGLAAAACLVFAFLLLRKGAPPDAYSYTPFASEAVDESEPAWSPNGQALAYVAMVDDTPQVFTRG